MLMFQLFLYDWDNLKKKSQLSFLSLKLDNYLFLVKKKKRMVNSTESSYCMVSYATWR